MNGTRVKASTHPFVSIIVPVLNAEDDIDRCLHSLLQQSYPTDAYEIIVVDNGSTDNTLKLLPRFPVRILRCSTPGPAAARNVGVAACRGELLLFTDIDCYADEKLIENYIIAFQLHQGLHQNDPVIGGGIGGYNTNLWAYCDDLCSWSLFHPNLTARTIKNFYPTANLFVSHKAFCQTGGFDIELRFGEDLEFCHRLKKFGYLLFFEPKAIVWHKNRTQFWQVLNHQKSWARADAELFDKGVFQVYRQPLQAFVYYIIFSLAYLLQPFYSAMMARRFSAFFLIPLVLFFRWKALKIKLQIHRQKRREPQPNYFTYTQL